MTPRCTPGTLLPYAAATVSAVSAVGFTTIGARADLDRLAAVESDPYALAHLQASLLTGTTAFTLTALITAVGGYLQAADDPGMRRAGRWMLAIACAPSLVSVGELLVLTPRDASHTIPFLLSPALITLGLWLDRKQQRGHKAGHARQA